MKGPVARAGLILSFSSPRGINVPKTEAKIITKNRAIIEDNVRAIESKNITLNISNTIEQIDAIMIDLPNSLIIFLKVLS